MPRRTALVPLVLLLSSACIGSLISGDHAMEKTREEVDDPPDNAIVLDFDRLQSSDESLLQAMESYVPSVQVNHSNTLTELCPRVSLRGPLTGSHYSNPLVYVNGTRMTNTCVLRNLRTVDLEQVELYPTGFTSRSGYVTHPHGLILVFSRRI